MDLLQESQAVKKEAEELLEHLGLLSELSRIGDLLIHGGFQYNLMLKRDIDIHLVSGDPSRARAGKVLEFFQANNCFFKTVFEDRSGEYAWKEGDGFPKGYIISGFCFWKGSNWTFDIYLMSPEERAKQLAPEMTKYFSESCSENTRKEILKSKKYLMENNIKYPASALYLSFKNKELKSVEEFIESLYEKESRI